MSAIAVLSTVAVDRVLDVVAVALLLAIVLPTADLPAWWASRACWLGLEGRPARSFCGYGVSLGRSLFLNF